jgi:uncharacterized protein
MAQPNPFLLAADNSPTLLPLLRSNPALASKQDDHGYSILHAAASYNHISLLRALVNELHVDVNLRDEDGETCLFVTETVDIAKCLVEELGIDQSIKNDEGLLAQETIEQDGSFPEVATYLKSIPTHTQDSLSNGAGSSGQGSQAPPPLPPNVTLNVGTMPEDGAEGDEQSPDPEFRRRIEELASRDNFHTEDGQQELRDLITDAVRGVHAENNSRDVRRRMN